MGRHALQRWSAREEFGESNERLKVERVVSLPDTHSLFGTGAGAIFETHVDTTDLERARGFYRDTLGLDEAHVILERQVAFYWIGGRGNAMLGVWGVAEDVWRPQHFAFTIAEAQIPASLARMRDVGIEILDFFGQPTDDPSVHAWMPACGIFFRDPDGNSLELVAMLAGHARPEAGVIPLSTWYAELSQPNELMPASDRQSRVESVDWSIADQ